MTPIVWLATGRCGVRPSIVVGVWYRTRREVQGSKNYFQHNGARRSSLALSLLASLRRAA